MEKSQTIFSNDELSDAISHAVACAYRFNEDDMLRQLFVTHLQALMAIELRRAEVLIAPLDTYPEK